LAGPKRPVNQNRLTKFVGWPPDAPNETGKFLCFADALAVREFGHPRSVWTPVSAPGVT